MEKREKCFTGKEYSILLPPVRQGMNICTRTAHMLCPILPAFVANKNNFGYDKFIPALQSTDPEEMDKLLMDSAIISNLSIGTVVVADKSLCEFERHFGQTENKKSLYPVLFWCLWENVKDFFPDWVASAQEKIKASIPAENQKKAHKLKSPKAGR